MMRHHAASSAPTPGSTSWSTVLGSKPQRTTSQCWKTCSCGPRALGKHPSLWVDRVAGDCGGKGQRRLQTATRSHFCAAHGHEEDVIRLKRDVGRLRSEHF